MSSLPAEEYRVNNSQRHLRASLISCFGVAFAFVVFRIVVRLHVQHQFALDDYLLSIAICGFTLMTGFLVHAINAGGFGRLTEEIPLPVLACGIRVSYVATMVITNLSIALLQLRISGGAYVLFKRLHYASMAIIVTVGLYQFFALLFQCYPISKKWTPTMTEGHCVDKDRIAIGAYVFSATNVVLTWYYALALAPLIWKLQLKIAVKLSSIFVLGLSILASIAAIIRFKYLLAFGATANPLSAFVPIVRWCWVELSLAISATSILAFRPILQSVLCCAKERSPTHLEDIQHVHNQRLRRGWTFQLREIDSMGSKEDGLPTTDVRKADTSSITPATTPGSFKDTSHSCYFTKGNSHDIGRAETKSLPDLEKGL